MTGLVTSNKLFCPACPVCNNVLDASGNKLEDKTITRNVCGNDFADTNEALVARGKRLETFYRRLTKSVNDQRNEAQMLQELWTIGDVVSKIVVLEEDGSKKTSYMYPKVIKYDAINPTPAFKAIADLIMNNTY